MTSFLPSRRLAAAAAVALLAATGVRAASDAAADTPAASAAAASTSAFDLATDPAFSGYRGAVVDWLRTQPRHPLAHVCLLAEADGHGGKWAWAVWREGRKIVLWDGGDSTLAGSRRLLDTRRDVVATEDDLHGSSYLVTRAWVASLNERCAQHGVALAITRAQLAATPSSPR